MTHEEGSLTLASNSLTELSFVAQLRMETRADHDAVDAAFSRFDLGTLEGYRNFLVAHARVLPAAERLIRPDALISAWRGRSAPLLADIAALDAVAPEQFSLELPGGEAGRWGALYVMEGSRLGGTVLAKRVADGLPCAYLSARHPPGAWSRILQALDQADGGLEWRRQAVEGAKAMFGAFLAASRAQG